MNKLKLPAVIELYGYYDDELLEDYFRDLGWNLKVKALSYNDNMGTKYAIIYTGKRPDTQTIRNLYEKRKNLH